MEETHNEEKTGNMQERIKMNVHKAKVTGTYANHEKKDEIKIALPFKINIPTLIVIIATICGLYLASPMFASGIPLNIDLPAHYLRLNCLSEHGFASNNWCPDINGGVPTSQYYFPIADEMTVLIGKLTGLEFAYKLIILLAYFAIPLGAMFLLRTAGHKTAGAMAYAFLLLEKGSWHAAGVQETLLVGFWHYTLTIGAWFFAIAFFMKLVNEPNKKNLFFSALTTMFITHPMTLLVAFFSYILVAGIYHKKVLQHWRWISAFAVLSLGLNLYFILPLMLKIGYFPSGISGKIFLSDFNNYIYSAIPLYVFILAAIGIFIAWKYDKHTMLIAAGSAVLLNIVFQFLPVFSRFAVGIRLGAFIAPFIFIFAALCIEFVSTMKINVEGKKTSIAIVAMLIFIIIAGILFHESIPYRQSIMTSGNPYFKPYTDLYASFSSLPPGRIAAEDTLYNFGDSPISFSHIHSMIPVLSDKEILTFGTYYFPKDYNLLTFDRNTIFDTPIEQYTYKQFNDIMTLFNIRYILVHDSHYAAALQNFTKQGQVIGNQFVLFETNITPSYFLISSGKLLDEHYDGISGSAYAQIEKPAKIFFKVNYYPNWAVFFNDKKIEAQNCAGIICAEIPGTGRVEFKYKTLWYEYFGYFISLASIIAIVSYTRKKDKLWWVER